MTLSMPDSVNASTLDANLNPLNEFMLFHGTKTDGIDILSDGFDERHSLGEGRSLFGYGVYFADRVGKADIYAHNRQDRKKCTIIVTRVCLGQPFQTRQQMPNAHGPPKGKDGSLHDSVQALTRQFGGCVDFTEFVVRGIQTYPEFMIEYHHKST